MFLKMWHAAISLYTYNLCTSKVHGGTTEEAIKHKVEKSLELARENKTKFRDVDTVLFFDEANTTGSRQ